MDKKIKAFPGSQGNTFTQENFQSEEFQASSPSDPRGHTVGVTKGEAVGKLVNVPLNFLGFSLKEILELPEGKGRKRC